MRSKVRLAWFAGRARRCEARNRTPVTDPERKSGAGFGPREVDWQALFRSGTPPGPLAYARAPRDASVLSRVLLLGLLQARPDERTKLREIVPRGAIALRHLGDLADVGFDAGARPLGNAEALRE